VNLSVRFTVSPVPAFADDLAIAHHDSTNERIRFDVSPTALSYFQSAAHPYGIVQGLRAGGHPMFSQGGSRRKRLHFNGMTE
jgi:hypothetical protein